MASQLNWSIIKRFSGRNMLGFTFQDVVNEFPTKQRASVARTLSGMVEKGMLYKIGKDKYHIIPLDADLDIYTPDSHQLAKYLMLNKEYYIGYASALKIHGLTRPSKVKESDERTYVITKKQMKPASTSIGESTFQFIHHDATRFFGFSKVWINQTEKAMVSDLEKTIVDMFTKPQFCGGIIEVGSVLHLTKDRTDNDKLFFYFARNKNKSAKKRFLFLTELLELQWTNEHETMMEELGPGISMLDPTAPDQGKQKSKFGLKVNVDPKQIKKAVLDPTAQ